MAKPRITYETKMEIQADKKVVDINEVIKDKDGVKRQSVAKVYFIFAKDKWEWKERPGPEIFDELKKRFRWLPDI